MKKRKIIKLLLSIFLIMLCILGIIFSLIYADKDDAPSFLLFGSLISIGFCLLIYKAFIKKIDM